MIIAKLKQSVVNKYGVEEQHIDTELHSFGDSSGVAFIEMRQYDRSGHPDKWHLSKCSPLKATTGERVELAMNPYA